MQPPPRDRQSGVVPGDDARQMRAVAEAVDEGQVLGLRLEGEVRTPHHLAREAVDRRDAGVDERDAHARTRVAAQPCVLRADDPSQRVQRPGIRRIRVLPPWRARPGQGDNHQDEARKAT